MKEDIKYLELLKLLTPTDKAGASNKKNPLILKNLKLITYFIAC